MRIVRSIRDLQHALRDARAAGAASVGMVPTMGALHEGHLSLVRAARAENDCVVLSIFVNPTQFDESADLEAYPRQEAQDAELAERGGADLIFAPTVDEMYPSGHATTVHVESPLTTLFEGARRGSAHFDGVATVVAKLLLAALPERAYFGQKDAQQLRVVQRMVRDLGIPTRIVACPTSRDRDGLARSSRNVRLSVDQRRRALAIPRALTAVEAAVAAGETDAALLRALAVETLAGTSSPEVGVGIDPEYVAIVDPDRFEPLDTLAGEALCAIAARVGGVRLIDNVLLHPPTTPKEG
ncbi:pantoate--beta-alanine ligase [Leucobacter rhizosphaerae]|uniref:Pantothenate synthetase n=1 Tax=Leucobacter rhizosphaerae TaxID=2932245 RepID=A0ABY4FZN0_9MICO|nr:pantoate--beta-alanine ligase [Leucobacter rhizosphaerae]UOQ61768.1 pantoate--beta-alanine ligase [Leucobacter rhizosphaerae]